MAKQTLAETVDESEIVDLGEEVGAPNFLIDDEFGWVGGYGDLALVQRKIAYRTGKVEDGENEGKVIRYINWVVVTPHSYAKTPFTIMENYRDYVSLRNFKNFSKEKDWNNIRKIYDDINNTIKSCLKSSQFTEEIKHQGELVDEIAKLKAELSKINKVLEEADELHELIKDKRKIIVGETEPKKRRLKLEE